MNTRQELETELDKILDLAGFQIFPAGANENRQKAKQALLTLQAKARLDEAGLWLNMVVKNETSRLDSNEWYKLNPRVVSKFWADRLAQLKASKEQK